ncbi:MAG: LPXTG cell wall anchor domain-containing protein [Thermoleophilia bacterium]
MTGGDRVRVKKNMGMMALVVLIAMCFVLMFAQAAMASGTVSPNSAGPQTTATGSSAPGTGAEMAVFGIAGASLLGAGFFMMKKSKA